VVDASSADVLPLAVLSVFVLPADLPSSDFAVIALPSLFSSLLLGAAVLESVASAPPDCAPDESSDRLGGVWSVVDVLSRDDLSDAEFRAGCGGDGSGACADRLEGSDWKLLSSREAKPPSGGGDGSRTGDFGGAL
jgi:hypothetical protein